MRTANVIEMRDASKWFGEVVAVNRLSIDVAPGVNAMLGPTRMVDTTLIRQGLGL